VSISKEFLHRLTTLIRSPTSPGDVERPAVFIWIDVSANGPEGVGLFPGAVGEILARTQGREQLANLPLALGPADGGKIYWSCWTV
jgi:hypothetical protein